MPQAAHALCRGSWSSARSVWLVLCFTLTTALLNIAAAPSYAQGAATLMADQIYIDSSGRLVASGSVEVWHGSVRMTASRVTYNQSGNQLSLEGPIRITDGPDTIILADGAQLSQSLRAGLLTSARVVLDQQLQIAAARIERRDDGISQMDAVVASSCPVCASNPTPLWEIRADRVTHNENTGQLDFERAQMRFAGVPVFYLPRLRLPSPGVERMRGILRPELNADSNLGLSVGLPYFIPFGDDRDLTLTPRLSTRRMASLGFRWRQAWSNGGIEIGGQVSRDQIMPGTLRGYAYARALFALRNDFRFSADLTVPSDRTYLETYDISSDSFLSAHFTLERYRRDQAIRARVLGFHSLRAADTNSQLPNAAVQAELDQRHGLEDWGIGGELRVRLGATAHHRRSHIDGVLGRDVGRAYAQLGWRRSDVLAGGILMTTALEGRADHVRVTDDTTYPAPINRAMVQGMVEFRWPWARSSAGGARSVIEPIVQVVSSRRQGGNLPNDDNLTPELDEGNLFAMRRYSGQGAPDTGSRINAGLRWSRHVAGGWSSEALAGRIWRREDYRGFNAAHQQPLGRSSSDWLLAGRLRHADGLAFSMRLLLSPDADLTRAETNLAWETGTVTLSSRYLYAPASSFENRTNDLSEWSFDVTRRFNNGWATRVGWEYDVSQSGFAAARTGLEYRNACLAFNLSVSRRFVTATNPTASNSYNMRVELLGIGGNAPQVNGRSCRA